MRECLGQLPPACRKRIGMVMDIIYFTVGLFTKVAINIKKISKPVKYHNVKTTISLQYRFYLFVSVVYSLS